MIYGTCQTNESKKYGERTQNIPDRDRSGGLIMKTFLRYNFPLQVFSLMTAVMLVSGIFLFSETELSAADSCETACNVYVECSAQIGGRQPSAKERETLKAGCMNTCNKKATQKNILTCYDKGYLNNNNSCQEYWQCILNKAQQYK